MIVCAYFNDFIVIYNSKMITSSNFFNKNLFLPDDDEENAEKLEEGQWMPVKSEKIYLPKDVQR